MNRRYLEFIKFYRRGMLVVFLFCLTFLFLIMTLFTSKLPSSIAILANILLVICAIFSLIIALINLKKIILISVLCCHKKLRGSVLILSIH